MNRFDPTRASHSDDDRDRDDRGDAVSVSATDRSVSAYLDGELDRAARAAFEARLSTDRALAESVEEQIALDRALRHTLGPLGRTDAEVAAAALAEVARGVERPSPTPGAGTLGPRPIRRRSTRTLLDPATVAVLALAASLLLVVRLLPPERVPVSPDVPRLARWNAADGVGVAVWIPDGVMRKDPLETPTDLLDGELITFGGPLRLELPHGMALLADDSELRFRGGVPQLRRGAVWVRSREPVEIDLEAMGRTIVRGQGSFLIDTATTGGLLIARSADRRSKVDRGWVEIANPALPRDGRSLSPGEVVALHPKGFVEPLTGAHPWMRFADETEALLAALDTDALRELAVAHVAIVADHGESSPITTHALALAADPAYRGGAIREAFGRLLRPPANAEDRRAALSIAGFLHALTRTVPIDPGMTEKLFELLPQVEPALFPELVPALAAATGIDPIPALDVWLEKHDRARERDYVEKWRAVWRMKVAEESERGD